MRASPKCTWMPTRGGSPWQDHQAGRCGPFHFLPPLLDSEQGPAKPHLEKTKAQGTGIAHSRVNGSLPVHQQLENGKAGLFLWEAQPHEKELLTEVRAGEEKQRLQEVLHSSIPNEASSHRSALDLASAPSC